jgi:MerR family transcriptional regulator/heat shock protein HspR
MANRQGSENGEPSLVSSQDRAVYIISVAAELAGVHPQTLRIYERKGLVMPARTAGNTRRYSDRDIERLRMIQRLTQAEGINLAGVRMIVEMEGELERMRGRVERLGRDLERARRRTQEEIERARSRALGGEIVPLSSLHGLRRRLREAEALGRQQRRMAANTPPGPIPVGPGEPEGSQG